MTSDVHLLLAEGDRRYRITDLGRMLLAGRLAGERDALDDGDDQADDDAGGSRDAPPRNRT